MRCTCTTASEDFLGSSCGAAETKDDPKNSVEVSEALPGPEAEAA